MKEYEANGFKLVENSTAYRGNISCILVATNDWKKGKKSSDEKAPEIEQGSDK